MKFFMFLAIGAVVLGTVYHTEVTQYLAGLADEARQSDGSMSVMDSIHDTGNSSRALMGHVGDALGQ